MITVLSEVFPQLIERRINRLQIEALYHDDEGKAIIDGQIAALEWAEDLVTDLLAVEEHPQINGFLLMDFLFADTTAQEDFESLVGEAGWGIERL